MNILTICHAGAVRSVTLAWVLRNKYHVDAIAIPLTRLSEETQYTMMNWADKIIITESSMEGNIPLDYMNKVIVLELGPDVWKQSLVPDCVKKCIDLIEASNLFPDRFTS